MNPFSSWQRAFVFGLVLLLVVLAGRHGDQLGDPGFWSFVARWLHVLAGVLWLGLLFYFNLVQMPSAARMPAELRPAIGKFIAPAALFWFRWSALVTVLTGLVVAHGAGYGVANLVTFAAPTIALGMWLAIVMAANVWFVIWPNQKRVLGLVAADDAAKAKAARVATHVSRVNLGLSVPMLYCMVAQQNVG